MRIPYLAFSLLLAVTEITTAAPYGSNGQPTEYQQPGGEKLLLRVFGDEYHARTETIEGYTVIFNPADQCYYYAQNSANGETLESVGIKADQPAPAGKAKHQALSAKAARKIAQANRDKFDSDRKQQWEQRVKARHQMRDIEAGVTPAPAPGDTTAAAQMEQAAIQAAPINGNKIGLTILVQFPDDPATPAADPTNFPTDQAKIDRFCNGVNYIEDGNSGSVRDYFSDQSNENLTYTQSVTQVITLPNSRSYYNTDPATGTIRDAGATGRLIIQDAITALQNAAFDFTNLSVDSGNRVIATNVLFAGADSGVWAKGLWPHASGISPTINVGTAQSPRYIYRYEITNISNASPVIGTFCHENGHLLLGYPDLYDYDGDSTGVGGHCLMGSGNYSNNGKTPSPINLYLKDMVGWANIVDLTTADGAATSLPTTGNEGRRIRKPGNAKEYFVVENRGTGDKWAASVPDKGICIWHIDEAKDGDSSQEMTSALHYEVSLEQADGEFDLEGDRSSDSTDLFDSIRPDFNGNTTPNAAWWDGTASGIKIHVTSAAGANMNVEFGNLLPVNTITVNTPDGGEIYYYDSTVNISWGANITGNVKIELLKGMVVQSVLGANQASDIPFSWIVPSDLPVGTDYQVRVSSVNNPAISDVSNANFEIKAQLTRSEALDTQNLVWTTGGTGNWFAQTTTTHDGVDAVQSGDISHDQSSYIQTTVTGPCTVSFWWKVSSEATYDFLTFYVDGVEQTGSLAKISGSVDWTQKSVIVASGTHTLKWEYDKDYSADGNADTAWLDQVAITQSSQEIVVEQPAGTGLTDNTSSVSCGSANFGGSALTHTFTIKNTGASDLTGLAVTKDGANAADFTVSALAATTLAAGAGTTFTVKFTPGAVGARNAAIHIASNDVDENPFDIALTGTGVNAPANSATWNNLAGGSWPVDGNWLNNVVGDGSGVTADFATLNLTANATVTLDGARTLGNLTFGDTTASHNWTLNTGSGGPLTLDVVTGSPTITVNNQTTSIAADIAGSDGLTKAATGTLVLSGTNTYTGTTTISGGTLLVQGPAVTTYAITTTTTTVASGATYKYDFSRGILSGGFTHTNLKAISISSGGTLELYSTLVSGGNGACLLDNGNVISGNGTLNKTGVGEVDFWTTAGALTNFTGPINVQQGTLNFQLPAATDASGQSSLTISQDATADIRTGTLKIDALMGSGTLGCSYNGSSLSSPNVLTIGNNNGGGTFSGIIRNGSATLPVTKNGTGTQIFSGANTYTGATTINGGTLLINGSLATTTTTVAAAGSLGGTGTIAGAVTNSGTLVPGSNGVGNLTINNTLILAPDSKIVWQISDWTGAAGSGYDKLTASTLNLTATTANRVVIRLSALALNKFSETNATFTLLQSNSTITDFDPAKFSLDTSGLTAPKGTWAIQRSGNNLELAYTANKDVNGNGIYDTWESTRFGNTNMGANSAKADADGDGLSNLMEYALNTNPVAPNANTVVHDREQLPDGQYLRITVQKNTEVPNLNYTVETGGTMNDWSTANTTIESNTATQLIVRDNIKSSAASRRFIRLRVQTTP